MVAGLLLYSCLLMTMWRDLKLNLSPKSPLTRSLSILPHLWDALGKESTALLWKCLILTDVNWGGPGASPQAPRERHLYLPSPPNEYKRPRNLFSYLFNPCALSARGPLRCDHPVHHPRPNGHYPCETVLSCLHTAVLWRMTSVGTNPNPWPPCLNLSFWSG